MCCNFILQGCERHKLQSNPLSYGILRTCHVFRWINEHVPLDEIGIEKKLNCIYIIILIDQNGRILIKLIIITIPG